jgi:hypothetical protein
MNIGSWHSHLNGFEWIQYHRPDAWEEIVHIIRAVDAKKHRTKKSKEKTKAGKLLYSPKEINSRMHEEFSKSQWHKSRTDHWVTDDYQLAQSLLLLPVAQQAGAIEAAGKEPIHSYNEIDFVKHKIAVEVQLGKYSYIAHDLFGKHQAFFISGTIDLAIEILPMKRMQEEMSSGPGYFEFALHMLASQGRGVPTVPLILIGIEP